MLGAYGSQAHARVRRLMSMSHVETAFDRTAQQLCHEVRILRLPPRGRATREEAGMAQEPQSSHWPFLLPPRLRA